MENASKALVIAGAILISILIIGLGVFIYNGAASTVSKASLNSQEAQAQNQQFEAYFGKKKSAAEVKQLCSLVRSNNITSNTGAENKYIALDYGGTDPKSATEANAVASKVTAGKTYDVSVANDNADEKASGTTDGGPEGETKGASYYRSGFIRRILIIENT